MGSIVFYKQNTSRIQKKIRLLLANYFLKIPKSHSTYNLLFPEAVKSIQEKIIPISTVVTPNLSEAKELTGTEVRTKEEMLTVAKELLKFGSKSVLLKGGHLKDSNESCDLLVTADDDYEWFNYPRIETKNTHGTGCTLSAAIASCLALGLDLFDSFRAAKKYISKALEAAQDQHISKGIGPVHHFYHLWPTLSKIIEEQND
ncbi:MAG: bifunctional hydroxymethylpyrimidine kinase/phosphomethylpyrimidine kinase [Wolbachia sp.]